MVLTQSFGSILTLPGGSYHTKSDNRSCRTSNRLTEWPFILGAMSAFTSGGGDGRQWGVRRPVRHYWRGPYGLGRRGGKAGAGSHRPPPIGPRSHGARHWRHQPDLQRRDNIFRRTHANFVVTSTGTIDPSWPSHGVAARDGQVVDRRVGRSWQFAICSGTNIGHVDRRGLKIQADWCSVDHAWYGSS